ncbi:LytR C-terminal domain-containing protein [bacterium]|nr:LytR C-terminal domain-containing protein [bacterium]
MALIEGRVEIMRSRRRKRKRRLIAVTVITVILIAVVLVLWRPWEAGETETGDEFHDRFDTTQVYELPEGDEPPDEIVLPERYSVAVWHTPGDAERLHDVEYQLAQLGQTEYNALPIDVLGTGNVNTVYYHGESEQLRSFAERLTELLGFPAPRRVDLSVTVGRDIEGLLSTAPGTSDLPEGVTGLTAEVLNGSGIAGMASRMTRKLGEFGVIVVDFRNNDTFDRERTTISCTPEKLEFALALKEALGLPGSVTGVPYDLQVILGGG